MPSWPPRKSAVAGNEQAMQDELVRAFDLLADARNHVYSVDFYVVDVTLLANSTLGESLRTNWHWEVLRAF